MQAIPATGIAQGIQYLELIQSSLLLKGPNGELPIVLCSLGDASVTEGEVSEAFQFAAFKQLPIIFLVQDNNRGISATSKEARVTDVYGFAEGTPGISRLRINGENFADSYKTLGEAINYVREHRTPGVIQAVVPLLGHHTSGVRREFYRTQEDLKKDAEGDPKILLLEHLTELGVSEKDLENIETEEKENIRLQFEKAAAAEEPDASTVLEHIFVPRRS